MLVGLISWGSIIFGSVAFKRQKNSAIQRNGQMSLGPIHHSLQMFTASHPGTSCVQVFDILQVNSHLPSPQNEQQTPLNNVPSAPKRRRVTSIPTIQDSGDMLVSGRVISIHQLILHSHSGNLSTPQIPTLDPLQNKHP